MDEPHSRHLVEASMPEMIEKMYKLVPKHHLIMAREIVEAIGISSNRHTIFYKNIWV